MTVTPLVRRAWHWHRPLMLMVAAMALLAVFSTGGLLFDDRTLLGAPIWEKPLKFALSFVAYGTTLAWMLSLPHKGRRWTRGIGTALAVCGIADVAFVAAAAAAGTFSHFNTADSTLNDIGQATFAIGVPGLMLTNLAIVCVLIWQRVGDRATALAVRIAAAYSVIGMGLGLLLSIKGGKYMAPYPDANGDSIPLAAGHVVGAPEDAAGMPITGWSTVGGDLRIPHFLGLHGMQVALLLALALGTLAVRVAWLRDERTRARLIAVAALGYTGLTATVTWQALRGQALLEPDAATWTALGVTGTVTAIGAAAVVGMGRRKAAAEERERVAVG